MLTEDAAVELEASWCNTYTDVQSQLGLASLDLRIADEEKRLERLTDLLLDGTIDNDIYRTRQKAGRMHL